MEKIETKTYVVRPIIKNKFSGQSFYNNTYTIIEGAQMGLNGLYKTGLTSSDETHYEEALSLSKGTLNKRNEDFWGNLQIRLKNDKLTIFTVSSPLDEIKHKLLLAHDRIANNEYEVEGNSESQFYIYDPEAASKIDSKKIETEFDALEKFHTLIFEEKKNLLRVYGKTGIDSLTETMVKSELYKNLKSDPIEFIRLFLSKDTPTRALISNLIEKNIIKKKGTYFYNGEDLLGSSTDEVVGYLSDIKNQAVKLALEGKLKPKK